MKTTSAADMCIEAARPLISPRAGLIRSVQELRVDPDDARLFYAFTRVAHTSSYSADAFDCYQENGGAGVTSEIASAAAIGETVERYSCSVYSTDEMELGTWEDLTANGLRALHPTEYPIFSERQYSQPDFPFQRFSEVSLHRWVPGWSLVNDHEIWLPASLVYIPYLAREPEAMLVDTVSTGLACSLDHWDAVRSGIAECVERDAVMICWLAKLATPSIDLSIDPDLAALHEQHFAGTGADYRLFDLTLDIPIPVFFGLAVDRKHEGLALAAGAAAGLDPLAAARKALVEAAQGRVWLKFMRATAGHWDYTGDPTTVRSFEDHVRLFGRLDMLPDAAFLLDQESATGLPPGVNTNGGPESAAREMIRRLARLGMDVIVVDVSAPDVAELGFHVIKTVIPGLQQLNADHRFRVLGSQRLAAAPVAAGYRDDPIDYGDLNPTPHPFP
jgi:ribosomal protein S12 methylthiotransferase accessory factor